MPIKAEQIYIDGDNWPQPLVVLSDSAILASLDDTNIDDPQDGDVLTFASGAWTNQAAG